MKNNEDINNILFFKLIENSIFTKRQTEIIINIRNNNKRVSEISSGAYYREVKQSKTKLKKLYYSILLLHLLGVIDNDKLSTLNAIVNKLKLIEFNHNNHHVNDILRIAEVIEDMINKMIKM